MKIKINPDSYREKMLVLAPKAQQRFLISNSHHYNSKISHFVFCKDTKSWLFEDDECCQIQGTLY